MRAFLVAAVLISAGGCGPRADAVVAAPIAAGGPWGGFRTLRAEHRVSVEARRDDGQLERRTLRGVVAVERPDRFRLRALGPGGIALFDVLWIAGTVEVIAAIRDPGGPLLSRLLRSIAGDLAAVYDLAPRPDHRRLASDGEVLRVVEPGRAIALSGFRRAPTGGLAPARIDVTNTEAGYTATIAEENVVLDEPLDPAMFQGRAPADAPPNE